MSLGDFGEGGEPAREGDGGRAEAQGEETGAPVGGSRCFVGSEYQEDGCGEHANEGEAPSDRVRGETEDADHAIRCRTAGHREGDHEEPRGEPSDANLSHGQVKLIDEEGREPEEGDVETELIAEMGEGGDDE